MAETVNHPQHYNTGKIEIIDFIEDQKFNFNLGNCVKYVSRADHKGNTEQDLQKAHWYLTRELKTRGIKTTEGKEYEDKFEEFSEFLENIHEHDINSYEEKIGKLEQMEKKLRDELSGLYRKNADLCLDIKQYEAILIQREDEIYKLVDNVDKLVDNVDKLRAENAMLKAQKGNWETKFNECNQDLNSLKYSLAGNVQRESDYIKQIEQLTKAVSQQEKKLLDIYYDNIHYRMK